MACNERSEAVQLWLHGGRPVRYREDNGRFLVSVGDGWWPAFDGEARAIQAEITAANLLKNEVLGVDSSLVTALFEIDVSLGSADTADLRKLRLGFDWDHVSMRASVEPEDMDADECVDWLDNESIDVPEKPEGEDDAAYLERLQALIEENIDEREVLEWWRVTTYLANKLREIGEPVLDNDYGEWWGRRTSGQAILMDGVLQEIALTLHATNKG